MAITPLQMAYAIGGIASGGVFRCPHLVFPTDITRYRPEAKVDHVQHVPLSEETIEQITLGMYGVVNESGGTGGRARIAGVEVAGKTGTAQVASAELTKAVSSPHLKDNAWFVGMVPRRNPEIVVGLPVRAWRARPPGRPYGPPGHQGVLGQTAALQATAVRHRSVGNRDR